MAACMPLRLLSIGLWLAMAGAIAFLYAVMGNTDQPAANGASAIEWLLVRWNWSGADMSHAWIIPFVSIWAVWQQRARLLGAFRQRDIRGLLIVGAGILLYLVGLRVQQTRIVLASAILLSFGVPFYIFGWAVARCLVFPCGYLVFCLPFTFLDDLTLPLRLIGTTVSAAVLNGFGIPVLRVGTALHVNAGEVFSLDVAHPCSGLRYLLAMVALTSAYAYFTQHGWIRRLILGLASVPLAIIGNIARILLIAVVGVWFGKDIAVGLYHDYSGYVVFGVATVLMMWIGGMLWRPAKVEVNDTIADEPQVASMTVGDLPAMIRSQVVLVVLLGITVALVPWSSCVRVEDSDAASVARVLPPVLDAWTGVDILYCQNEQCNRSFKSTELGAGDQCCRLCGTVLDRMSLGERTLLPADTLLSRKLYSSALGVQILATIVMTGQDQRSIHRPEQCLPAQGYAVSGRSEVCVAIPDRASLPMTVLTAYPARNAESGGDAPVFLAYWFAGGGHVTHDHLRRVFWMAWDNLIHARKVRWAYVSLMTTGSSGDKQGEAQLADFARCLWPQLNLVR